jgi:hypothetical protein
VTTTTITEITRRALEIIRDHDISYPGQFGLFMWPEDRLTHNQYRRRNAAAGGYLGRLAKRGLVRWRFRPNSSERQFYLTDTGRAALEHVHAS